MGRPHQNRSNTTAAGSSEHSGHDKPLGLPWLWTDLKTHWIWPLMKPFPRLGTIRVCSPNLRGLGICSHCLCVHSGRHMCWRHRYPPSPSLSLALSRYCFSEDSPRGHESILISLCTLCLTLISNWFILQGPPHHGRPPCWSFNCRHHKERKPCVTATICKLHLQNTSRRLLGTQRVSWVCLQLILFLRDECVIFSVVVFVCSQINISLLHGSKKDGIHT